MTIKFEHVNLLGPWTRSKDDLTHYILYHNERKIEAISNSDFETLFKDMAKELGYSIEILKKNNKILFNDYRDVLYDRNINHGNRLDKLQLRLDDLWNMFIKDRDDQIRKLDELEDKVTEPAWPLYLRKDDFDTIKYDLQEQIDHLGTRKISHIEHTEHIEKIEHNIKSISTAINRIQSRLDKLEQDIESNRDD